MLIADISVCEEDPRLDEASHESPVIHVHAFEKTTRNLPYQTLRAQQCAMELKTLPQRARCALAAIALVVDCRKPLASIFAHRDYLADRAGISERTWFRAEKDLVAAGLITINDQGRKARGGRFGAAFIYLTVEAVRLLRFLEALAQPKRRVSRVHQEVSQLSAEGHLQEEGAGAQSDLSVDSPTATSADAFTNVYLSPDTQERQPVSPSLPADLERLRDLGFHEFLIFKLMKEARNNGKRLSDVVEAIWEHLKVAARPINYLRKLLSQPIDFKHVAKEKQVKVERRAENQLGVQAATAAAGQIFESLDGQMTYEVSTDATILTVHHTGEARPRIAAGNSWQQWFGQALITGTVRRKAREARVVTLDQLDRGKDKSAGIEAREACMATIKAGLKGRHQRFARAIA